MGHAAKTISDARGRPLRSGPCYFGMDGTFYIPNAFRHGQILEYIFQDK